MSAEHKVARVRINIELFLARFCLPYDTQIVHAHMDKQEGVLELIVEHKDLKPVQLDMNDEHPEIPMALPTVKRQPSELFQGWGQ